MTLRNIRGVYYIVTRDISGKPQRISTRCRNRSDALKVASESGIHDLERAALSGRLTQQAIGHIITGRKLTMKQVLPQFNGWMIACGRSAKTIQNNYSTAFRWMTEMAVDHLPPAGITVDHIAKWINDKDSKRNRASRAVALSCIRTLFSFMSANGWIVSDPSRLVNVDFSIMSHKQKTSKERVPFTDEEVNNLLEYLSNNNESFWLFAVVYSKETGLRLSDIAQMEWASFQGSKIAVWTDKTNTKIEHNLTMAMQALMDEIIPTDPKYLFPEQCAIIRDVKKRGILSVQFKRICEKVGIEGKSFHCLRHRRLDVESIDTMAKRLATKLSMEDMRKLLGHSSSKMTERYAHD